MYRLQRSDFKYKKDIQDLELTNRERSIYGKLLTIDIKGRVVLLNCLERMHSEGYSKTYKSKLDMRNLLRYRG